MSQSEVNPAPYIDPTAMEQATSLFPRFQAYLELIQSLLTCEVGEEAKILELNKDLIDPNFLDLVDDFANQANQNGEEGIANFLNELSQSLKKAIAEMISQRLPAYRQLVHGLLTCPQGEERAILASHQDLLDRGLIEILGQTAGSLMVNGQSDAANFLMAIAHDLTASPSLEADSSTSNISANLAPKVEKKESTPFLITKIKDLMGLFHPSQDSSSKEPIQPNSLEPPIQPPQKPPALNPSVEVPEQKELKNEPSPQIPYFLLRLLQITKDSQGQPQSVYGLINANLGLVNLEMGISLSKWANHTLTNVDSVTAQAVAKDLTQLGTLLLRCPLGDSAIFLELAIACYESALTVLDQVNAPLVWAAMQNNLAIAYSDRRQGIKLDNLERAIGCYRSALEVYTRTAYPEDWAMTQNNLARVYCDRLLGNQTDNLNRAIVIYQSILEIYTKSSTSELWALTQMNLAQAYEQLTSDRPQESLTAAINHYQAALEVYQKQAFPQQWANIHQKLEAISQQQTQRRLEMTLQYSDQVLQLGNQVFAPSELVPLLTKYELLPSLIKELIIDRAIASIVCTESELGECLEQFERVHDFTAETRRSWLLQRNIAEEQLSDWVTRSLRLEKYKQEAFDHKLLSHFLQRKPQIDSISYRIIRHTDPNVIQEIFFRLQANEQSFEALAKEFSQGEEVQSEGLIGPVAIGSLHPSLAKAFFSISPGELLGPMQVGESVVIIRLEKLIPARLNESTRQFLLDELFQEWIQAQLTEIL